MKHVREMHHSIADWDVHLNRFILSSDHFISPPTSVKLASGILDRGVCRVAATLCLPEGRIVCWWRAPSNGYNHLWFRVQSPVGDANPDFFYYCSFTSDADVDLGKYIPGWHGDIGSWPFPWPFNAWFQVRVTWEILPPINGNKRMKVKFEADTGAGFVDYGDIIDEEAHFEDSALNRVGLVIRSLTSYNDNYQVYRKA